MANHVTTGNRHSLTMEHEQTVHLLDLPDEILLRIIKELASVDVLYSLLGVNKRLDQMARNLDYQKSLDFSNIFSRDQSWSSYDTLIDRFCQHIFPQIHQNLEALTIDYRYTKNILLAAQYPRLRQIRIRNCWPNCVFNWITEESSIVRLFEEQITHLSFVNNQQQGSDMLFTYGCGRLITTCKKLIYFDSRRFCNSKYTLFSLDRLPLNTCSSSQLQVLLVNVRTFDDCLRLLDGRLSQLFSFTVNIQSIDEYHDNILLRRISSNLKEFSLTSYPLTKKYGAWIIPLLRRMVNLERLGLYLNIKRKIFIDGHHFRKRVFPYLPKLNAFQFHLTTTISTYNATRLLSAKNIQRSFTDWKYSPIHCSVYYFADQLGVCHIYSNVVKITSLKFIANRFRCCPFQFVTDLTLYGTSSFEHDFFRWIARAFPLLKSFKLHNLTAQEDKRQMKVINKYLHLTMLNLTHAHIDYAFQFLSHTNTHLPNLHTLIIQYEQLVTVTNNFTSDLISINCAQVKKVLMNELIPYPEHFFLYFPFLEK